MEQITGISAVEPPQKYFDAVEIAGLVVPVLFAIMAIVMVSLNPDPGQPGAKADKVPAEQAERVKQIHKR